MLDGLVHHRGDLLWEANVGLDDQRLSTQGADLIGHLAEGSRQLGVRVDGLSGQGNVGPFAGGSQGDCGADAATSTRNQDNLIFKTHGDSPGDWLTG